MDESNDDTNANGSEEMSIRDHPEAVVVLVQVEGTGTCFCLEVNDDDTWNGLAKQLRCYINLPEGDIVFHFHDGVFTQSELSMLKTVSVRSRAPMTIQR